MGNGWEKPPTQARLLSQRGHALFARLKLHERTDLASVDSVRHDLGRHGTAKSVTTGLAEVFTFATTAQSVPHQLHSQT